MSRKEKCAFGNWQGSKFFKLYKNGPAGRLLRTQPGTETRHETGCKGKRGPPRRSNPGQVCAEGPWGLGALAWEFHKRLIRFCRFGFEDLFLGLPVLSAPPRPTWPRVKVGWIQEELGSRCPEDFDRKPVSNNFLLSPCRKPQCSYLTNVLETALGWTALLAALLVAGPERGPAPASSLGDLHSQGTWVAQPMASPMFLRWGIRNVGVEGPH